MTDDDRKARLTSIRRPPPPFETVRVVDRVERSPRLVRLTLEGAAVRSMRVTQPASSVRFVVPWPDESLELPEWNGNEFLLADGRRPALRTFTPLRVDNDAARFELEIVRHPGGAVSQWAESADVDEEAGVSGPAAGYDYPTDAERLLVLGDETAIPAIGQVIEMAPTELALEVHVEVIRDDAVVDLPERSGDAIEWHVTPDGSRASMVPGGELVAVVKGLAEIPSRTGVWAAGEAASMQAIRKHLFQTLGVERKRAAVRGYWKPD